MKDTGVVYIGGLDVRCLDVRGWDVKGLDVGGYNVGGFGCSEVWGLSKKTHKKSVKAAKTLVFKKDGTQGYPI